jgi:hypothetical protein
MATFTEVWRDIQDRISEGMEIANWSVEHDLTGHVTRIGRVYYESIDVIGERGTRPITVKRTEFKEVYDSAWDGYKAGRIPRNKVGSLGVV